LPRIQEETVSKSTSSVNDLSILFKTLRVKEGVMRKRAATPHNKGKVAVLTVRTKPGLSNILIEDIIRKASSCNGVVSVAVAFQRAKKETPTGVVEVLWPLPKEEGPTLLDFMEDIDFTSKGDEDGETDV
jgi:hypothetical protein